MLSQLKLGIMKYNKSSVLALLLFSPCILAQTCTSNDKCSVGVDFKGNYLEKTCDVSINNGSMYETVVLPVISVTTLDHEGAEAGSQLFSITLKNCPTNKAISLYFASTSAGVDALTGNLPNAKGADYSEHVEVRLRNSESQQMLVDDPESNQNYDVSLSGDVTHYYMASYYAADNTQVTAGLLNTSAAIVVSYK